MTDEEIADAARAQAVETFDDEHPLAILGAFFLPTASAPLCVPVLTSTAWH